MYKIIHLKNHTYRYEIHIQSGIKSCELPTLQEAINGLVKDVRILNGTTITDDNIQYFEWDLAMDIVRPSSLEEGFKIAKIIDHQHCLWSRAKKH